MPTPPGIIETRPFTRIWDHLGLKVEDLLAMQNECFLQLKSAPVISGCAGARKMRFSPKSIASGKSGALRVVFKYFEQFQIVIQILVYPKGVKESITSEDKKGIAQAMSVIEFELERRFKRNSV